MNVLRLALILAACACAAVAVSLGFDWRWFGIDDGREWTGWIAASLLLFEASHLTGGK